MKVWNTTIAVSIAACMLGAPAVFAQSAVVTGTANAGAVAGATGRSASEMGGASATNGPGKSTGNSGVGLTGTGLGMGSTNYGGSPAAGGMVGAR